MENIHRFTVKAATWKAAICSETAARKSALSERNKPFQIAAFSSQQNHLGRLVKKEKWNETERHCSALGLHFAASGRRFRSPFTVNLF